MMSQWGWFWSRDTVDQMREKHANNIFSRLGIACILWFLEGLFNRPKFLAWLKANSEDPQKWDSHSHTTPHARLIRNPWSMGMVWEAYWEGGPTFGDLWRNALSGNHPFSKIILSKNTWICLKRFAVHNKIHHHFFTTICKNTFRIFFQALYANPIKTLKGSLKDSK